MTGRRMKVVVPELGLLVAVMVPPCAVASSLTTASPMPDPSARVVRPRKNRSKMCGRSVSGYRAGIADPQFGPPGYVLDRDGDDPARRDEFQGVDELVGDDLTDPVVVAVDEHLVEVGAHRDPGQTESVAEVLDRGFDEVGEREHAPVQSEGGCVGRGKSRRRCRESGTSFGFCFDAGERRGHGVDPASGHDVAPHATAWSAVGAHLTAEFGGSHGHLAARYWLLRRRRRPAATMTA